MAAPATWWLCSLLGWCDQSVFGPLVRDTRIVMFRHPAPAVELDSVLNHRLHFVMAVVMATTAWPWGTRVPTTGPAVFFLLAAVWFVTVAGFAARTTAL